MQEAILKRFESPDEVRVFDKGRFEIVHIGGLTSGWHAAVRSGTCRVGGFRACGSCFC